MPVLPFPSFRNAVKEKGARKAILDLVDETVERATAGLRVRDIRELLRGDPPSRRPNPRLAPHTDSFWMHLRPAYYHASVTGFYPTLRLGWLTAFFFVVEIVTGLCLMAFYTPSPASAYANTLNILSNVPFGQLIRDLHYLSADGMVLCALLHMLRTFITGSFKKPRQFTWATGVILLLATLFVSFSGSLLPWDQLSYWAATPDPGVAAAPPDMGAGGLLHFYLLHVVVLPLVIVIFFCVHYYQVVLHGHSLPPGQEEVGAEAAKDVPPPHRVYFLPDVLTTDLLWIGAATFILLVLAIWFYHAPLAGPADPQVMPLYTTVPWYFLWLRGLLTLGNKVLFGVIVPVILLLFFLVYPYLDVGQSRRYAHRRLGLSLGILAVAAFVILSWMGSPEYAVRASGDREIVQALAPTEGVGPVRAIPFDELVPGTYHTAALDDGATATGLTAQYQAEGRNMDRFTISAVPEDAPALLAVMQEFNRSLAVRGGDLPNAWGALMIQDWQTDLKRVEITIEWDSTDEAGQPVRAHSGSVVYIHAGSGYFDGGQ